MTHFLLQKATILYILVGQLNARLLDSEKSNSNSNSNSASTKDNKSGVTKINIKEEENSSSLGVILFSVLAVVGSIIIILILVIWLRRYRFKKLIQLENARNQHIQEKASSISISQSFRGPNQSQQFRFQPHQESPLSLPQSQQIIGQNIIQPNQIQTDGVAQQLLPPNQNQQEGGIRSIQQQPLSNGQNNDQKDPYHLLSAQLGTNLLLQKLIINMLTNKQEGVLKQNNNQQSGQSNLILNQNANSNNISTSSVNHALNRSRSRDDVQIPNISELRVNSISERNNGKQFNINESTPTPIEPESKVNNAVNNSNNLGINLNEQINLNSDINKENFENKLKALLEQNSQYLSSLKINLQFDKSSNLNEKEGFLQLPINKQNENEEESEIKHEGDECNNNNNNRNSISSKIQALNESSKSNNNECTIQKIEKAILELNVNKLIKNEKYLQFNKQQQQQVENHALLDQEDNQQNSLNANIFKMSIPEKQQQQAPCELLEKEPIQQIPGNTEHQQQSDMNLLRPAVIGAKYQQLRNKIIKNDPNINKPKELSTNDGSEDIQNPVSLLCNQCKQNQLSIIFSCGHMSCEACSEKCTITCPFCNAPIMPKKRIFFS